MIVAVAALHRLWSRAAKISCRSHHWSQSSNSAANV